MSAIESSFSNSQIFFLDNFWRKGNLWRYFYNANKPMNGPSPPNSKMWLIIGGAVKWGTESEFSIYTVSKDQIQTATTLPAIASIFYGVLSPGVSHGTFVPLTMPFPVPVTSDQIIYQDQIVDGSYSLLGLEVDSNLFEDKNPPQIVLNIPNPLPVKVIGR